MQHFSQLIDTIEMTNKTNAKIDALVRFFQEAEEKDKLWLIAIFTGKRSKRPIKSTLLKDWCIEATGVPDWLYRECYGAVGDSAETISLLLPQPSHRIHKPLYQWMAELGEIRKESDDYKKEYVLKAWDGLPQQERFIFNKLIGGSFRIGVSKKTLVNALARFSGNDANMLMHSIIGKWEVGVISFEELVSGEHINYDESRPYPFCLAYAVEGEVSNLGQPEDWQAEYKWDGIRGQIVRRNDKIFIWSRGEELVTKQFPELVETFQNSDKEFVIDGEILPLKDGSVLKFNDLQKRLNRKNVTKKLLEDVPVGFYAYDCLEFNGEDIRSQSLIDRREKLVAVVDPIINHTIKLPQVVQFNKWEDLIDVRENARSLNSEGLMLKSKSSIYHTGRKKGDWWKWKVDPLTIDAVMIYAQRGSGRRSSHYTDYTFAVKDGEKLVTIAKAYSGLTDKEITEVSRFVKRNAIEKFGPVRTVKPELVFEIAFEGIALSSRHKSGVALRFPRILRWRRDKPVAEIDTIESVKALIDAK